jgi:uncharacterized protein YodC (DUF2158 family)
MSEIQAGDVVRLKSGGPRMTVKKVERAQGEDYALCQWFLDGEMKRSAFSPASLQIAEEQASSGS